MANSRAMIGWGKLKSCGVRGSIVSFCCLFILVMVCIDMHIQHIYAIYTQTLTIFHPYIIFVYSEDLAK